MKIVVNRCFGGFSLSDEAFELYLKKKGITNFYKRFKLGVTHYFTIPPEQYDKFEYASMALHGDYRDVNDAGFYLSYLDIERTDKFLIEVIEELGDRANSSVSKLEVVEIPDETDYEISDYDGYETIEEKHRKW